MQSLTVEIPDFLADALAAHVAQTAGSSPSKATCGALALWLLQSGQEGPELTRAYLDAILPARPSAASLRRPRRPSSGADAA